MRQRQRAQALRLVDRVGEIELEQTAEALDRLLVGQDGPDLVDEDLLDVCPPRLDGGAGDPDVGAVVIRDLRDVR